MARRALRTRRPPRPTPRTSRLAGTMAGLALILAACGDDTTEAEATGPSVPDQAFETFEGEETTLEALADRPMVVNFWASWCPPCAAEMPDFERVHLDVADDVRFVGINTQDPEQPALDLAEATGVSYDLAWDPDGDLFRAFGVAAMPTTYFVDEDGVIVHQHAGLMTEQQLRDAIDDHL